MGETIALVIKGSFEDPFTAHYARGNSAFTDDDQLLVDELTRRGHSVVGVPWDDSAKDWSAYDLVFIRSTWDFLFRKVQFNSWLDRMEAERRGDIEGGRPGCSAIFPGDYGVRRVEFRLL